MIAPAADSLRGARLQPWADVRRDELAGLRGVLTDIDDTLTRDGEIEPDALAALHALAAAKVPVIAITGRPARWSEPFVHAWPVCAIVAENGGVLLRRAAAGGIAHAYTVDEAERRERSARLQRCAAAVLAQVEGATLARDSAGRLTDIAVDHSEFAHLDEARISAVVQLMQAHGLTATVSSIHVNGWIGAHSKWTAARWAVQTVLGWRFDAAEWLYVGDSTNDQLMFEHVRASVGVANIARFLPQLQVLPRWVTARERGLGFAEVAQRWLALRA